MRASIRNFKIYTLNTLFVLVKIADTTTRRTYDLLICQTYLMEHTRLFGGLLALANYSLPLHP
jgi:hypothetical protein